MKRWLTRIFTFALLIAGTAAATATPVTMSFSASGFQNAGTQYPGFSGFVQGTISWDANLPSDPITQLLSIDLTIAGHAYALNEVGVANNGASQTAIGGLVRGANAVVGDGAYDDFLLVFDRVEPELIAFAYSIAGKTNAIWWTPAQTQARFVDVNQVPEPASLELVCLCLAALALSRRRRGHWR